MKAELWLTEGVLLTALCRDPSELLNAMSREGIPSSELRDHGDGHFTLLVRAADAKRVILLGNRCGTELMLQKRRGSFHFWRRFRRRLYLLLIPFLLILPFVYLSTFLWEIEVCGNKTLSTSEVLSALESVGVYPGVSGLRLDNPQIRSRMQELLSDLSWCTVQVHGSRARVVVRERRLPPEIVDESLEREVAALRSGTVEVLQVLEGKPAVSRGDTVLPGDLLISGQLTDRQAQLRRVHAQGRVIARTWYEMTMEMPLSVTEKSYTGETVQKRGIKIGDLSLIFYRDGSIFKADYDKINNERQLSLLGFGLPLFLLRQDLREYRLLERALPAEDAEELLKARLLNWLHSAAPEADILETTFRTEAGEQALRVTMLATCREDIGTERPLSP